MREYVLCWRIGDHPLKKAGNSRVKGKLRSREMFSLNESSRSEIAEMSNDLLCLAAISGTKYLCSAQIKKFGQVRLRTNVGWK